MALKSTPEFIMVVTNRSDLAARETNGFDSVCSRSNGADAQVNAEMVGGRKNFTFGYFKSLEEIPILPRTFEIGLTFGILEEMFAFLSCLKLNPHSFREGAQRDAILFRIKDHHAWIESDRRIGLKLDLRKNSEFLAIFRFTTGVETFDFNVVVPDLS
ncbi:MAG: hypothetical protein JWN14_3128, partial [Chthonomonadales bacterium]|nr:hypothetical protein [Chthonomonadales bacterium]